MAELHIHLARDLLPNSLFLHSEGVSQTSLGRLDYQVFGHSSLRSCFFYTTCLIFSSVLLPIVFNCLLDRFVGHSLE